MLSLKGIKLPATVRREPSGRKPHMQERIDRESRRCHERFAEKAKLPFTRTHVLHQSMRSYRGSTEAQTSRGIKVRCCQHTSWGLLSNKHEARSTETSAINILLSPLPSHLAFQLPMTQWIADWRNKNYG
jgi:hypothetical protein